MYRRRRLGELDLADSWGTYVHVSFFLAQALHGAKPLHFCLRRLQLSQASAVRCRLSSRAFGGVMLG